MSNDQEAKIQPRIFDGTRQPMQPGVQVLIRLRNGNQEEISDDEYSAGSIPIFSVPFFNNLGDRYTVVASADEFAIAGFYPVKVSLEITQVVDLMLLPKKNRLDFGQAQWPALQAAHPDLVTLLSHGATSAQAAQSRYEQLMSASPASLASFFNLSTAMAGISLPQGTPLTYIKELIWDASFAQDRFFAYADITLVDQVKRACAEGEFDPEPGAGLLHPGATSSYKQNQFGEANVQLTFHENAENHRTIDGIDCITVEPDIDYYADLAAHTVLEVIPNTIGHTLTDPKVVYVLRWMAGRHAGVAEFSPPYTIVKA
jgi:hypothetical protein